MHLPTPFLISFLLPIAGLASVRRDAVVVNASDDPIVVCYIDGSPDKKIEPGRERQIVFPPPAEILPIKTKGTVFRFGCVNPPGEFLKVGMFKSVFRIVFASDHKLYIAQPETSPGNLTWQTAQPNGWPLAPLTEKSPNQAAEPSRPTVTAPAGAGARASAAPGSP